MTMRQTPGEDALLETLNLLGMLFFDLFDNLAALLVAFRLVGARCVGCERDCCC